MKIPLCDVCLKTHDENLNKIPRQFFETRKTCNKNCDSWIDYLVVFKRKIEIDNLHKTYIKKGYSENEITEFDLPTIELASKLNNEEWKELLDFYDQ